MKPERLAEIKAETQTTDYRAEVGGWWDEAITEMVDYIQELEARVRELEGKASRYSEAVAKAWSDGFDRGQEESRPVQCPLHLESNPMRRCEMEKGHKGPCLAWNEP